MTCARPRNSSSPASVVIHGCTLITAIQKPCHMPTTSPTASTIRTAGSVGMCMSTINTPAIAEANATTEPTDRSMFPPVRMHRSMPMPSTNTYMFCKIRFVTFRGFSIVPSVTTSRTRIRTARAMPIVYCRMFERIAFLKFAMLHYSFEL